MTSAGTSLLSRREHDVALAPLTTLRVGGHAASYLEANTDDELVSTVAACDEAGEPLLVLSGGSNVVVADTGFGGTVVKVATRGIYELRDGDDVVVTIAAGESWDRFVARAVSDGWAGVELLSGIPGSVGATPIQNVGAYGREVAEVITQVTAYDRNAREIVEIPAGECGFGYRSSSFKKQPGRWVVLSVTMHLVAGAPSAPIRYADLADRLDLARGDTTSPIRVRRAVLDVRRSKGMVLDIDDHDTWSVGSFFTNPVVAPQFSAQLPDEAPRWPMRDGLIKLSAAWLIDHSGFGKGWPHDPQKKAGLSTKHSLAITNRGGASATEIVELAREVRDGVRAETGITLVPEPVLVGLTF